LKNLLSLTLFLLLIVSGNASAQIITTKKEAQKKGVYSYSEKQKAPATAKPSIDKQAVIKEVSSINKDVLAYEPVKKEMTKTSGRLEAPAVQKNPIMKKSVIVLNDKTDPDYSISSDSEASYVAQQAANNAVAEFKGVRYHGGGTTKAGMDCSGMVYATFKLFDITLPRSSHEMVKATKEVKLSEVKKGDLLFFKNNRHKSSINHVGLVTDVTEEGEVLFIHSSTSSGVIISSMNEPYNSRTFFQAGRYVAE
jgi:cell wall-associated NlpC family hydrolase